MGSNNDCCMCILGSILYIALAIIAGTISCIPCMVIMTIINIHNIPYMLYYSYWIGITVFHTNDVI